MRSVLLVATVLLLLSSIALFSPGSATPTRAADTSLPCADFDGDGAVTVTDIFVIASRFGQAESAPGWELPYDLTGDGAITVADVFAAAAQFGMFCSLPGDTVPFETIAQGYFSGIGSHPAELRVARNDDEWQALWAEYTGIFLPPPPPPPVDFEDEMVVGLFDSHFTGGYELTVDRISVGQDEMVIEATHTSPGPTCFVIQVLTNPYHIVRVQRTDLPIRTALKQVITFC